MRATKILMMIVCGIGVTPVKANTSPVQGQTKDPEMLIVNIWINGLDYKTEAITFTEDRKKFIECASCQRLFFRRLLPGRLFLLRIPARRFLRFFFPTRRPPKQNRRNQRASETISNPYHPLHRVHPPDNHQFMPA